MAAPTKIRLASRAYDGVLPILRGQRAIPSLVEAWPNHYLGDEQTIFQCDPWAYGLEANRQVLNKFFGYCHAQGISGRVIAPEEIFHPSTLTLSE